MATHIGPLSKTCRVDDGPTVGLLAGILGPSERKVQIIFLHTGFNVFLAAQKIRLVVTRRIF